MADYGLIKSFDIDSGQLDGLRLKDAFVLGYELAEIDHTLKSSVAISRPVHVENRQRIEKSCADAGRNYRITWSSGDPSEAWLMLDVAPGEPSADM